MTCFYPLKAYQAAMPNSEGKRPVIFNPMKAKNHNDLFLSLKSLSGRYAQFRGQAACYL
nr:MAG TPA: hypothetical protein [Microviridae sp.]